MQKSKPFPRRTLLSECHIANRVEKNMFFRVYEQVWQVEELDEDGKVISTFTEKKNHERFYRYLTRI